MTPIAQRALAESFFGPLPGPADDFGAEILLDVPLDTCEQAAVAHALARRMAQLNAHPRGRSGEAALLRSLLHRAASRLLGTSETPARSESGGAGVAPVGATWLGSSRNGAARGHDEGSATDGAYTVEPPAPARGASGGATGARADAPGAGSSATARPRVPANQELVKEIRLILARTGRIDQQALARLRAFALERDIPIESVPAAVYAVAAGQDGFGQSAEPTRGASRDEVDLRGALGPADLPVPIRPSDGLDEGQRILRRAVVGTLVFVGVVALAMVAVLLAVRGSGGSGAAGLAAPPSGGASTARGSSVAQASPQASSSRTVAPAEVLAQPDGPALVRLARASAEQSVSDAPRAAAAFAKAQAQIGDWWFLLDAGERTSVAEAMVEAVLRAGANPALLDAIVSEVVGTGPAEPVPMTAADIAPRAWRIGLLTRLSRERELPEAAASRIGERLDGLIGRGRLAGATAFTAGARAALAGVPIRVLALTEGVRDSRVTPASAAEAMERWERCVRALAEGPQGESQAERMVLDGIEQLLVAGPEPDRDQAVYEMVFSACARLRWRPNDPSRGRLLTWFDRPDISASDMAVVTTAIVTKSSAEGVDLSMALTPIATQEARASLRDRYASAWSIRARGLSPAASWAAAARAELAAPQGATQLETLRSAAALARLSQAAWHNARGEAQAASDVLKLDLPALQRVALAALQASGVATHASDSDGSWGVRFITARTASEKRLALQELESSRRLGQADADVLVEAAFRSDQADVRSAAQATLLKMAQEPTALNAMLNTLPRAGRSPGIARIIESVTPQQIGSWQSPQWPLRARRAVVEALLERLASGADTATMDTLAAEIATAYAVAAQISLTTPSVATTDAPRVAAQAAERLYANLRARCQRYPASENAPLPLALLDERHNGRVAVAAGVVQVFAAHQASAAEALAYLVSAERPAVASEVRAVLDALAAQRRAAPDLIAQIRATEAAVVRLHLLRVGDGGV